MVDSRIQDAAKNQMGMMMVDAAMRVEAAEHNSKSLGFMRCCTLRIIWPSNGRVWTCIAGVGSWGFRIFRVACLMILEVYILGIWNHFIGNCVCVLLGSCVRVIRGRGRLSGKKMRWSANFFFEGNTLVLNGFFENNPTWHVFSQENIPNKNKQNHHLNININFDHPLDFCSSRLSW